MPHNAAALAACVAAVTALSAPHPVAAQGDISDEWLIALIVAAVVGVVLVFAAVILWYILYVQRREDEEEEVAKTAAVVAAATGGNSLVAAQAAASFRRQLSSHGSFKAGSKESTMMVALAAARWSKSQHMLRTGSDVGASRGAVTSGGVDAPGVPTVSKISGNILTLEWAAPALEGLDAVIHHYNVKFKAGEREFSLPTSGNNPQFTIRGMPPGTRLDHIRVSAVIGGKDGLETSDSKHVFAITHDVPAPPTGLTGHGVAHSVVLLTWSPPQHNGRTSIRRYLVRYVCDGVVTAFSTHDATPRCTINDLPNSAVLSGVTVAAVNDVGEGDPSAVLASVRPLQTQVPELTVVATRPVGGGALMRQASDAAGLSPGSERDGAESTITDNTLIVADAESRGMHGRDFGPPKPVGFVVYYTHEGTEHKVNTHSVDTRFVLSGLPHGDVIENIRVSAVAPSGDVGEPSNTVTNVQVPGNTPPPEGARVTHTTPDAVMVEWDQPAQEVSHYIVSCNVNGEARTFVTPNAEPRCRLAPLPSGADVAGIAVRCVVGDVAGAPSQPVDATTLLWKEAPRNLTVLKATGTTVELIWDPPPDQTMAHVTSYIVSYSTDSGVRYQVNTHNTGTSFVVGGGAGDPVSEPLAPATELFDIRVHAVTSDGNPTDATEPVSARTLRLPHGVHKLRKRVLDGHSIALSWVPPTRRVATAKITSHVIRFTVTTVAGDRLSKEVIVPGKAVSHVIQGLPPGSTVGPISVAPVCELGEGREATVPGRGLPSAPRWLTVDPVAADGGLPLRWTAPEDTGGCRVLRYTLRMSLPFAMHGGGGTHTSPRRSHHVRGDWGGAGSSRSVGSHGSAGTGSATSSSFFSMDLEGPGTSTVLRELPNGLGLASRLPLRHISVSAVNIVGTGPASNKVSHVGESVPATPPLRLVAGHVPTDVSAIPLRWEPPQHDGGAPIFGYVIRYKLGDSVTFSKQTTIQAATRCRLEGPGPGTTISDIRVAALTVAGEGAWSNSVSVEPPSPPTLLRAGPMRASTIRLSWTPPRARTGCPVTGYRVRYTINDGEEVVADVDGHPTYALTGVEPSDTVRVWVSALNIIGESRPSRPVEVVPVQAGAPTGLRVVSATPVSVKLEWDAAECEDETLLLGHIVEYTLDGITRTLNTESAATSAVLRDLPDGGVISNVRVAAVTSGAQGPFSAPLERATTLRPPPPPARARVLEVTSDAVVITWNRPLAPGDMAEVPVTGYHITYRSHSGSRREVRCKPTARVATIDGLGRGSVMSEIAICAVNMAGTGEPQAIHGQVVTHNVPAAPGNVRATAVGDDFATVEFDSVPHDQSGGMPVTGYILAATVAGDTFERQLRPGELAWTIRSLVPGSRVENIRVCAVNEVGRGVWGGGASVHAETQGGRPAAPGRPRLRRVIRESHELVLMWPHTDFPLGADQDGGHGSSGSDDGSGSGPDQQGRVVRFELQWARTTVGIKEAARAITHGVGESKGGDSSVQTWRHCKSSTVNAQPQSEWQMATVKVVPDRSYDFRVRGVNARGQQSAWSETSRPVFLKKPIPPRPTRRHVPTLPTNARGAFMGKADDVRRYIIDNMAADGEYDRAMKEWLRLQCWGALRTWAWLSRALPPHVLASEAQRLASQRRTPASSPSLRDPGDAKASPVGRPAPGIAARSPYDGAGASSSHIRSLPSGSPKRGGAHVSAFVRQGRRKWVRPAMAAAHGRRALLELIPGTPLYRSPGGKGRGSRGTRANAAGAGHGHGDASSARHRSLGRRLHLPSRTDEREERGTAYRHQRYPKPPASKPGPSPKTAVARRGRAHVPAKTSEPGAESPQTVVVVSPPSVDRKAQPNTRRRGGIAAVVDHQDHQRRTQDAKARQHQRSAEAVVPRRPTSLRRAQQRAAMHSRQRSFKRAGKQHSGRRLRQAVPEYGELVSVSVPVPPSSRASRAYPASALGSGAQLVRHHRNKQRSPAITDARGRDGGSVLPGLDNVTVGNTPPLALFVSPQSVTSATSLTSNPLAAANGERAASPQVSRTQVWSLA